MGCTTSTRRPARTVQQGSHVDTNTVQGSHVFQISRYSLYLRAYESSFAVGGYDWQIVVFAAGLHERCREYMSVYLSLESRKKNVKVTASVQFSLLDVTGSSPPHTMTTETTELHSGTDNCTGLAEFIKGTELKTSTYLHKDRLTIECIITIFKKPQVVEVPPSDITHHLGKLLQSKEDADVIFEAGGEDFPAHKTVLAMRSPVFKAELFGAMREKDMSRIIIGDMQPDVFDALLHFIYTDSLPAMNDLGRNEYIETIRHLLVAVGRYGMERLKIMCESILYKNIDAKTVMTTVALADQHHCGRLHDACLYFISSLDTKELGDLMASQGYAEHKSICPLALVELWEKKCRLGKSKF